MSHPSVLSPEVISLQLRSGPGSTPLRAAARSWDVLADELRAAAVRVWFVIAELKQSCQSPAVVVIAETAEWYIKELGTDAAWAEQIAVFADAAAAAFDTARDAVVAVEVVEANRAEVAQLTKLNLVGQNTPEIAALDGEYIGMGATNKAAMTAYESAVLGALKQLDLWLQLHHAHPKPSAPVSSIATASTTAVTSTAAGNTGVLSLGSADYGFFQKQ